MPGSVLGAEIIIVGRVRGGVVIANVEDELASGGRNNKIIVCWAPGWLSWLNSWFLLRS